MQVLFIAVGMVTATFAFYAQMNPHLYEQKRQIVLAVHHLTAVF
jgi:hypothetical protein